MSNWNLPDPPQGWTPDGNTPRKVKGGSVEMYYLCGMWMLRECDSGTTLEYPVAIRDGYHYLTLDEAGKLTRVPTGLEYRCDSLPDWHTSKRTGRSGGMDSILGCMHAGTRYRYPEAGNEDVFDTQKPEHMTDEDWQADQNLAAELADEPEPAKELLKNIEMTSLNADGTTETHRYDQINEYEFRRVEPEYCECDYRDDNIAANYRAIANRIGTPAGDCYCCGRQFNPVWTWHPGDPKPTTTPKGCVEVNPNGEMLECTGCSEIEYWKQSTYRWNILENPDLEFEPAKTPKQDIIRCNTCDTVLDVIDNSKVKVKACSQCGWVVVGHVNSIDGVTK